MASLIFSNSIQINASAEKVWRVLTESQFTQRYMYGCEIVSDWKVGSPFSWRSFGDGKLYVKGSLLELTSNHLLVCTAIDPNAVYEDVPENYTNLAYKLTENDGQTILEVTQGDFGIVADGEKRYAEAVSGWEMVLPKIKELSESL